MSESNQLERRFRGAMLGLAVGDALGARFEGWEADDIRRYFPTPEAYLDRLPSERLTRVEEAVTPLERAAAELEAMQPESRTLLYTDDTEMMIGVAEALLAEDLPAEAGYAARYAENYTPWRGYGRSARVTLECLQNGMPADVAATLLFPDGSYGNGAAMRVAPVGLRFSAQPEELTRQARASATPTHRHPLGIEGAVIMARAVAHAVGATRFDRAGLFDDVLRVASSETFRAQVERAAAAEDPAEIATLGNEITAQRSVPAALACFASNPESFVTAVGGAVLLGGDCDTIAAMTGALAGAFLGEEVLPGFWLDALEDGEKGRAHIEGLATRLAALTLGRTTD